MVHFDWYTCATLVAVVVVDGMRRVPTGGIVLRHLPGSGWQVVAGPVEEARLRFVSIFSPLTLHCVIAPAAVGTFSSLPRRVAGAWVVVLRGLGGLELVLLLVGLPWLLAVLGGRGFVIALAAIILTSIVTSVVAAYAFKSLQLGWWESLHAAAPLLWPFSTPTAAERLVERSLRGLDPLGAAHLLLPEPCFAAWVRPFAYDALQEGTALSGVLTLEEARTLVATQPDGLFAGERFCGRCGGSFVTRVQVCIDCGVDLQPEGGRSRARVRRRNRGRRGRR
jgi:hypothetical protein